MSGVSAYVTLHLTAMGIGLIVGLVGGFLGGVLYARWTDSAVGRSDRVRTIGGAVIALMAIGTMARTFIATDHQAQCNTEFRNGRIAVSQAQGSYNAADKEFVQADTAFVQADRKFVRAQQDYLDVVASRGVDWIRRDTALATYRTAMAAKDNADGVKEAANDRKLAALADIERVRAENPTAAPEDC